MHSFLILLVTSIYFLVQLTIHSTVYKSWMRCGRKKCGLVSRASMNCSLNSTTVGVSALAIGPCVRNTTVAEAVARTCLCPCGTCIVSSGNYIGSAILVSRLHTCLSARQDIRTEVFSVDLVVAFTVVDRTFVIRITRWQAYLQHPI